MEQAPEDFTEFYRRRRDECLRAVYASVGDRLLAEDLVAEAFAKAWASWRKVSCHPAPEGWIVRTALNTHVSWWRRRRREVAWDPPDTTVTVQGQAQSGEYPDERVLAAVRDLPARQREVIVLRFVLDLDTATTARTLGIAPGTVTAHLARAVAALRDRLAPALKEETRSW